jgi:predicted DNA-binding transcriptional regulator YafY
VKIDRLIAIIMLLMERKVIGAAELAEMFEVSLRTIYRDIEAIGRAGVPITSSTGPGGGIGIMDSYKMEKRLFSASDVTALLIGLGHMQNSLPSDKLVSTLAKIRGMIPDEEYKRLEVKANQIKIDMSPWHEKSILPQILETIRFALDNKQVICFRYCTRENTESNREVEPYRLLLKGMNWYLQGYCRLRQDYRTFKLLRMRDISLLNETFQLHGIPLDQLDRFDFGNNPIDVVTLRVDETILDQMAAHFGYESIKPDGMGHYTVTAHLPVEEDTACFLIRFSNHCTCLGPTKMREMIKDLLEQTLKQYKDELG